MRRLTAVGGELSDPDLEEERAIDDGVPLGLPGTVGYTHRQPIPEARIFARALMLSTPSKYGSNTVLATELQVARNDAPSNSTDHSAGRPSADGTGVSM